MAEKVLLIEGVCLKELNLFGGDIWKEFIVEVMN
jgi:hypothetical protein